MKNIFYIIAAFILSGFTACVDLEIPPKTIIFTEDLFNENGIEAYMAGMYRMLPMNDFKVNNSSSNTGYFNWQGSASYDVSTGETSNEDAMGLTLHSSGYWTEAWKIIRNANRMIEMLPDYASELTLAEEWIAESYFIRAYVYFTMASRYGGLPILDKMMVYDSDFTKLEVARSSCEDTYDFILKDLDIAIAGMPETTPVGRANKYVAATLKTRVALFAATTAKYGGDFIYMSKRDPNLMLCGIPAGRATDYFKQAWDAADVVIKSGRYQLNGVGATDPLAQEKAYNEVFTNALNSKESIFIRKYELNNYVHSFDALHCPERLRSAYGNRYGPTLDLVELFDGKTRKGEDFVGPDGRINVINEDGTYKVFDDPGELYANVEPRLKASIFIPLESYVKSDISILFDVRAGVILEEYDPSIPISKFHPDDYTTNSSYDGALYPFFNTYVRRNSGSPRSQTDPITLENGTKIFRGGLEGPSYQNLWSTHTGIHGKKWIDFNLPRARTNLHQSTQPWIDMRLAEVMLNRAEAAIELFQSGTANYQGVDMQQDAFEQINAIRQRGGADLLTNPSELSTEPAYHRLNNPGKGAFVFAPNRGVQIVRVERYKELHNEHKLYWDLRRWFTFHEQIYNYCRRKLNPFMFMNGAEGIDDGGWSVATGKMIYDPRTCEGGGSSGKLTFNGLNNYYEGIPSGELRKSELLEGNRNQ